ncbi:unnamed protein product [Closterium sp. NIES-65]|nr:unnamed protein product [Closterium sp. NIES-65]
MSVQTLMLAALLSLSILATAADPLTTPADPLATPADPLAIPANSLATPADPLATAADPLGTAADPLATAAAAAKTAGIIGELKALRQKLMLNPRLRYLVMSQVLSQLITQGKALPTAMDLTLFIHTTILIPTDAALLSSGLLPNLKNPGASLNLFKSLSFNIIKGKKRFAKLKALPEGKSVALLLNNGKLFRHTLCAPRNLLSFASPASPLPPPCFPPHSSLLPPSLLPASPLPPPCFPPPFSLLPPSLLPASPLLPPCFPHPSSLPPPSHRPASPLPMPCFPLPIPCFTPPSALLPPSLRPVSPLPMPCFPLPSPCFPPPSALLPPSLRPVSPLPPPCFPPPSALLPPSIRPASPSLCPASPHLRPAYPQPHREEGRTRNKGPTQQLLLASGDADDANQDTACFSPQWVRMGRFCWLRRLKRRRTALCGVEGGYRGLETWVEGQTGGGTEGGRDRSGGTEGGGQRGGTEGDAQREMVRRGGRDGEG